MNRRPVLCSALAILAALLMTSGFALGTTMAFDDEGAFQTAAGSWTLESFETIPIDHWIYKTQLPSPMSALDLDDDPNDPNDGPDYDLDGHFAITGNSIAYAPADRLFKVIDFGTTPPGVDGSNFLAFSPWYNILWPKLFDEANQHPIVTFDNFENRDAPINAFGLYFHDYLPDDQRWIVMEFGDEYVPVDLTGGRDNYFFGYVSDTPFDHVRIHTNQNGGSIRIDAVSYRPADVPEASSWLLLGLGWVGLATALRRRARRRDRGPGEA